MRACRLLESEVGSMSGARGAQAPGLFSREPVGLDHSRGVAQAYFHQGSRTGFPSVPGGEWPVP